MHVLAHVCLGCHLFWWQLPELSTWDLVTTFPALACYCVSTYPVSSPFPPCFHSFPSKFYSVFLFSSVFCYYTFFSPFSLSPSSLSNLLSLPTLPSSFLLNYTAHSFLQCQSYRNIGGGVSLFLFLEHGVKLLMAIVQLQKRSFFSSG